MKALILAAGYATRLYPLTINIPKPLLMVGPKPMIEHIIDRVMEIPSVDEIFIVTNDKFFTTFVEWSNGFAKRLPVKVLNDGTTTNDNRLGAVGDIEFVIKAEDIDDDFLVIAGDNLFDFSLAKIDGFFNEKKASLLAVYDLKDKSLLAKKFGVVELDKNHKVIGFEEKPAHPKTSLTATACYLLTRKDVKELSRCVQEIHPDNLGDFIKWLSVKKAVYGFVPEGFWCDIGSHEQLALVREK